MKSSFTSSCDIVKDIAFLLSQSRAGSEFAERLLTVVAILRQQQRHVLTYVTAACQAALHNQAPPSLLPVAESALSVNLRKAA